MVDYQLKKIICEQINLPTDEYKKEKQPQYKIATAAELREWCNLYITLASR